VLGTGFIQLGNSFYEPKEKHLKLLSADPLPSPRKIFDHPHLTPQYLPLYFSFPVFPWEDSIVLARCPLPPQLVSLEKSFLLQVEIRPKTGRRLPHPLPKTFYSYPVCAVVVRPPKGCSLLAIYPCSLFSRLIRSFQGHDHDPCLILSAIAYTCTSLSESPDLQLSLSFPRVPPI